MKSTPLRFFLGDGHGPGQKCMGNLTNATGNKADGG